MKFEEHGYREIYGLEEPKFEVSKYEVDTDQDSDDRVRLRKNDGNDKRVESKLMARLKYAQNVMYRTKRDFLKYGAGNIHHAVFKTKEESWWRSKFTRIIEQYIRTDVDRQQTNKPMPRLKVTQDAIDMAKKYVGWAASDEEDKKKKQTAVESGLNPWREKGEIFTSKKPIRDRLKGHCGVKDPMEIGKIIELCAYKEDEASPSGATKTNSEKFACQAYVTIEVTRITNGGNCNEHADTAAGLIIADAENVKKDLGEHWLMRTGVGTLDHEFLIFSPYPIMNKQPRQNQCYKVKRGKKTQTLQPKDEVPRDAVCIDSWPAIGQALRWKDSRWYTGDDWREDQTLTYEFSLTELIQLKKDFADDPEAFGYRRDWLKILRTKENQEKAKTLAWSAVAGQIKADKPKFREIERLGAAIAELKAAIKAGKDTERKYEEVFTGSNLDTVNQQFHEWRRTQVKKKEEVKKLKRSQLLKEPSALLDELVQVKEQLSAQPAHFYPNTTTNAKMYHREGRLRQILDRRYWKNEWEKMNKALGKSSGDRSGWFKLPWC